MHFLSPPRTYPKDDEQGMLMKQTKAYHQI